MGRHRDTARNEQLVEFAADPEIDYETLAQVYGITSQRVSQIAREYGIERRSVRTCPVCGQRYFATTHHGHDRRVPIAPELLAHLRDMRAQGASYWQLGREAMDLGIPYKSQQSAAASLHYQLRRNALDPS